MDPYDLSIRLKVLDGQWEEVGAEAVRYRGVWPENVQYSHNEWGDDTCSFDLHRDPGAIHPDLSAFTDCEIHVAGRLSWAGRVKETPTREGADPVINVQGEGWQYHLDDDQYERAYVHSRLSEWKDGRQFLDTDLAFRTQAWNVQTGDGAIIIGFPSGATAGASTSASVILDMGPGPGAKRVVLTISGGGWLGGGVLLRGSNGSPTGNEESFTLSATVPTSVTTYRQTFASPRRYVEILLANGAASAGGSDTVTFMRIESAQVFSDTAYESGDASVLRADQILTDALDSATLLLDTDRSEIEQGDFAEIPEFATSQLVSPREAWQAANAFENKESKIDARRPIFRARATAPIYEIGEWSGAEFEDTSANSGAEILNRVFVEGQTAAAERLVVERWATGDVDYGITQPTNPSADTNTTGWAATPGTITRDTAQFDSTPASFLITGGLGSPTTVTGTTAAALAKGRRYRLSLAIRTRADLSSFEIRVLTGATVLAEHAELRSVLLPSPHFPAGADLVWRTVTLDWVQPADAASYTIEVDAGGTLVPLMNFDTLQLARSAATLVDRRGFAKSRTLPIRNRITQASGERLSDLYLDEHRTTPFAGGFKAVGVGGVRRVLGGARVHPGWLGRDTGQLVRASQVIDPDTGGVGRDERIKTVQYDHPTLTATVSLAEDRGGFAALLEQLAAVVGS